MSTPLNPEKEATALVGLLTHSLTEEPLSNFAKNLLGYSILSRITMSPIGAASVPILAVLPIYV